MRSRCLVPQLFCAPYLGDSGKELKASAKAVAIEATHTYGPNESFRYGVLHAFVLTLVHCSSMAALFPAVQTMHVRLSFCAELRVHCCCAFLHSKKPLPTMPASP